MSKTNPCCPKFDPSRYVNKELTLDGKLFVQDTVYSLFYIPITFGRVTNRVLTKLVDNQADPLPEEVMTLQQVYPCSPWSSQVFFLATKEVEGLATTNLPGKFLTRVYQGPYSDVGKWVKDIQEIVKKDKGHDTKQILAFHPYCPGCIKHYGENYVVMMAEIE